jgi:hypothetical protein
MARSARGKARWPRSPMKASGALVVNPSFQPGNGKRSALSTMEGRTRAWGTPLPTMACSPSDFVYV